MNIKFITLALVAATATVFGGQISYGTKSADIIVIGGGAAGCILMKELSEKGQFSVLGNRGGAKCNK